MRQTAAGLILIVLLSSAAALGQAFEPSQMVGIEVDPALCPAGLGIPPRPLVDATLAPGDIYVTADRVDLIEEGVSHLEGNVEIARDGRQARAEIVDYNSHREYADLQGAVNYWDESVYSLSPSARLEFDDGTGTLPDAEYRLPGVWGRGRADELFLDSDGFTLGKNIDFSTCAPQKNLWDLSGNIWKLSAKEMILNHKSERGTARHAVLKIKDLPVFYTPYISFPLSMKRKSGFLMPTYGSSNNYGLELRTPYYWNIASNRDATFTPRILSDSGVMLIGEYRYLFKRARGLLNVEYLPGDTKFNNKDRSYIHFEHSQSFSKRARVNLLYNRVSDTRYFENFGAALTATSIQTLPRRANFNLAGNWRHYNWNLSTQIQDFQIVNEALAITARPYRHLPRIQFSAHSRQQNNRLNLHLKSEAIYFQRGKDPSLNNVEGLRLDLFPAVSYPMQAIFGYLRPELGLRYTQYRLNTNRRFAERTPHRVLPLVSVDGGLYFDKEGKFFGRGYSQTLEPRLFYLYIPKDDQDDLPVFDTSLYDTTSSYSTLFYKDRFSGPDRMGDANQVTLALTSRFQQHDSALQGSVTIGQAFYLQDREVSLPGRSVQTEAYSPTIIEYRLTPFRHLRLSGHYHWDFENKRTRKLSFRAQYRPGPDRVINAGYRRVNVPPDIIRRAIVSVEQANVSFRWPLGKNWSAIGRWYYDVPREKTIDMFGGLEYNSCCWALRAGARRFLATTGGEFQTGIFLQVELKGLAGLGRQALESITQQIPGYQGDF